jgi:hypothetical protein
MTLARISPGERGLEERADARDVALIRKPASSRIR